MTLPGMNRRIERLEAVLGPRKPEASWAGRLTEEEQQFMSALSQKYGQEVNLKMVSNEELDRLEQIALRIEGLATGDHLPPAA